MNLFKIERIIHNICLYVCDSSCESENLFQPIPFQTQSTKACNYSTLHTAVNVLRQQQSQKGTLSTTLNIDNNVSLFMAEPSRVVINKRIEWKLKCWSRGHEHQIVTGVSFFTSE